MSFELSSLALNYDAELHLVHPVTEAPLYAKPDPKGDPEGKPVKILMHGTASPQYRKSVDVLMKKNAKRGNKPATPDEIRESSVEFLVALAVKAENLMLDGEPLDNKEAFRKMFSDERYSWVKSQCDSFLGNTENFIK